MSAPECVSLSNIIIDDIVLWDGRTLMGTLGGAGTHAVVGMRVWGGSHGMVAWVGEDFDPAMRAQLASMDTDLRGLGLRHSPSTRAWQIIEQDDRRHEIFRTSLSVFVELAPDLADVPEAYFGARAMHLMPNGPVTRTVRLIRELRARAPRLQFVFEPPPEQAGATAVDYAPVLPLLALFSPDIDQAHAITGRAEPADMAAALIDAGAPLVAIRMGARGSLVRAANGECWRIPAVPPRAIVDVTGAGNAYCGGFAVSLGRGLGVLESALRAAVSASIALEQFGVPRFDELTEEEITRRLTWAREHAAPATA